MYYTSGNDDGGTAGPGAVRRASSSKCDGGVAARISGTKQSLQSGTAGSTLAGPATAGDTRAGRGTAESTLADLEAMERVLLIREIRALEDLKGVIAAAQARAAAAFDASTRRAQAAAGLKADQLGKGVAAEVALARRESPHHGAKLLGLARILTTEMPHTLAALSAGVISEWRATLLVRETACLSLADRQEVDRQVAGNLAELEQLGDRKLIARIKSLSYGLDPHAVVKRAAHAVSERFVSCRPAPDTMTYLTALLPVAQGVGVYAALTREADRLRAAGDPRTKGQIMADTFVERTTGQARAEDVRIEVQLIMTDQALLHGILPTGPTTTSPAAGPENADAAPATEGTASTAGSDPNDAGAGRSGDRGAGAGAGSGSRSAGQSRSWAGAGINPGGPHRFLPGVGPVEPDANLDAMASAEPATGAQDTSFAPESFIPESFVPDGAEPAVLTGYGIVPAQWARDLIRGPNPTEAEAESESESEPGGTGADTDTDTDTSWGTPPTRPDPHTEVWLRRLYIAPTSGQLTAMDSRARLVPHGLARLIAARDQVCRTPWCGAPIRHYDHIKPVHAGGATTAQNIQGLCQACNQAKEAPDWKARAADFPAGSDRSGGSERHIVVTTTPTGHVYRSSAPRLPQR